MKRDYPGPDGWGGLLAGRTVRWRTPGRRRRTPGRRRRVAGVPAYVLAGPGGKRRPATRSRSPAPTRPSVSTSWLVLHATEGGLWSGTPVGGSTDRTATRRLRRHRVHVGNRRNHSGCRQRPFSGQAATVLAALTGQGDMGKPRNHTVPGSSPVEMAGIEPASDGRPRVLLRAQSAEHFSAPGAVQTRHPDGLSRLSVGADPPTRSVPSGSLYDARNRAGSTTRTDGLKAQAAIRQRERSRCDCVRHLLVCTHRSRAERASSTRFSSIDDRRRNRSSPVELSPHPDRTTLEPLVPDPQV